MAQSGWTAGGDPSLLYSSGAHPASYPVDTGGSLPGVGGKAAGTCS
jgi:hypothetical protein